MNLKLSRFPLRQFLENAVSMISEKALKQGLSLSVEVSPESDVEIEADKRKMSQIMFNLLSNAVKFSLEGGSVWVCARKVQGSRFRKKH